MILVTGGAGYIGSHTILNLINTDKEIIIFDNLETGHIETVQTLQKLGNVFFEKGDLLNIDDIERVFTKYKIDAVIHFAAFSLVEESVKNPAKYYRNNFVGALNLVDTMLKYNCNKIIFSSTCATYGEPQYVPIDESHPQNPINPYGKSKLMIEHLLKDYQNAYGLKYVILRYFNVAGADKKARIGEWHDTETHLIPNILKSVFDDNKIFKIFGDDYYTHDGTCIRDYINIEDLAQAHRLALEYLKKYNRSDIFNIGTETGTSVKSIFNICEKILNKKIPLEITQRRKGDPAKLYANSARAKEFLKWEPIKSIEDSISSAYEWEKILKSQKVYSNIL